MEYWQLLAAVDVAIFLCICTAVGTTALSAVINDFCDRCLGPYVFLVGSAATAALICATIFLCHYVDSVAPTQASTPQVTETK